MVLQKLTLKKSTTDIEYTRLCNFAEKQGIFRACGNCEEKWILLHFETDTDYLAWLIANNFLTIVEKIR
jgi:hypothetical protein